MVSRLTYISSARCLQVEAAFSISWPVLWSFGVLKINGSEYSTWCIVSGCAIAQPLPTWPPNAGKRQLRVVDPVLTTLGPELPLQDCMIDACSGGFRVCDVGDT